MEVIIITIKKIIIGFITGLLAGVFIIGRILLNVISKVTNDDDKTIFKFKEYYSLLITWIKLKDVEINIGDYLVKQGYKTVAIYGMGEIGKSLYKELSKSKIKISYAIDQNIEDNYRELPVIRKESIYKVDAIIVTPVFAYINIKKDLEKYIKCPIISMDSILYDIQRSIKYE